MSAPTRYRESTRGDLGEGFYSLTELGNYLALSGSGRDADRASWWLRGVLAPVGHKPRQPDYSFSDLVSLFVVRELRKKGVSVQGIRDAEKYLRRKWNTDRPFISDEIQTDGRGVYVDEDLIPGQIEAAEREGQQVMLVAVKDLLESVHYRDSIARAWEPMEHIVLDPRIQFGDPVIAGTRLLTSVVAETARRRGVERATAQLDVRQDAIEAAMALERRLHAFSN